MKKAPRGQVDYIALDRLLSGETVTAVELATTAGVEEPAARAAIRRIVNGLKRWVIFEKAGRKIYAIRMRGTRVDDHATLVNADLLRAISIAHSLMGGLAGTEVRAALRTHLDQLLQESGASIDDYSRRLRARARAMRPNPSGATVTEAVLRALFESRKLVVKYTDTRNATSELELAPLTLLLDDLGLHLYAKCTQAEQAPERLGKFSTYALSRFDGESIRVLDRVTYPAPDEFNAEDVFGPAFGLFVPRANEGGVEEVVLRFDASWRSYLENSALHPSQKVTVLESTQESASTIVVSLHVYITYDLVHWIRGHGRSVSVERPQRLKIWVESGAGLDGPSRS